MDKEQAEKQPVCKPYQPLGEWQTDWIKNCCLPPPTSTNGGCDCCFDEWTRELKETSLQLNAKVEEAAQGTVRYGFLIERRGILKSWVEDLQKADELAKTICGAFEVLEAQIQRIHSNSEYTIQAINFLFCMIRDFYVSVDRLRITYDLLWNCILSLNDSEVNRSGLYKALQVYNQKLEAVSKTRDEIVKLIIQAIRFSNQIEEELSENFGLQQVLVCWKKDLNCKPVDERPDPCVNTEQEKPCTEIPKDCKFELPFATLPIIRSEYYKKIKKLYTCHDNVSSSELTILIELNKQKEELAGRAESLKRAIDETKPELRCK